MSWQGRAFMSGFKTQPGIVTVVMEFDSAEMARRGRLGALALHSRHDSKEISANARKAFRAKFEQQVDPDGVLPEAERKRRAEFARREFYTRIAHKSAESRRQKKAQASPAGA